MPSVMNLLDPVIGRVIIEPWSVRATEAGRFARGLRATVQLWHHETMRLSRTLNMDQDEVEEIAGTFAAICAIDAAIVEQAIRDLHTEIEGALRRQQDAPRHRQKEELGEEAAWQGPSIAESFKVQDDGVWYFPPTPPDQEPHPPIWVCAPLRI